MFLVCYNIKQHCSLLVMTSSDMANSNLESLASVRALIVNPSTSEDTITVISETLVHYLQQNRQPLLLHHHVLKLLSDLALHHHHLSHFVFNTIRAYALVCDDSRLIVQALAALVTVAEQSQSSSLESAIAEINEDFVLSLSLSPYVSVRSWILSNALRFQLQPRHLVTMFLGFTNDLYPYVKRAALDGLVSLCNSYDIEQSELIGECYNRAVDLLLDTNACVRSAAIHVVSDWGQKLAVSDHKVRNKDAVFVKICSMVRDMSMEVRNEAFLSLGKIKSVSEDMLLQTLSKKVLRRYATKESDLSASNAAGAFVHGLEDEFYEVRRSACNSLGMLTKFSIRFSNDALNLLMDMLNDDYMVVRLQTLETMYDMATCDRLKVQETHMHMFLGTLVDTNALIRCAARNILRLVKLQAVEIFKSSISRLLTNLETYPEDEADIFSVLFNMGKNHGNFAVSFFKEVSEEIKPSCEGELSFDNARVAGILVLTIAAPLTHENHVFNIPTEVFKYAVPFLGRISSSLSDVATQDTLLACFSPCRRFNRFPGDSLGQEDCRNLVMEPVESSRAANSNTDETMNQLVSLPHISYGTCGKSQSNIWDLMHRTSAQVLQQRETSIHEVVKENVDNILRVAVKTWMPIKSGYTNEARKTLRSCEEELATIVVDSHVFLSLLAFASQYIRAIHSLAEVWIHFLPQRNFHAHRTGMLDLSLEKLDTSLRELRYQYVGMSKEEELHVLELILLACVMRLSKFEICFHLKSLKRLHATISRVEVLQDEGSVELSDFVLELKKSLSEGGSLVDPFLSKRLIEFFSLKQMLFYGKFKHIKANLDVPGNDSEKPFPFISGLPLGITFQITLFNISSKDRLWLKMAVGESIQYVYLDFNGSGGNKEIRKVTLNAPFYRTPKASSFSLRACIGKECPFEDTGNQTKGQGGPKCELTFLCSEKEIFVAAIERG